MSFEPNAVTAIDILLDPDATMMTHAQAANARLLKSFSKATHWTSPINRISLVCSGM
jgi:hypothetical protein